MELVWYHWAGIVLVGVMQSNIGRLESGSYNPSLAFLQKVAKGLGKELHLELR